MTSTRMNTASAPIGSQALAEHAVSKFWPKVLERYPEANFLQSPAWGKVNELVGHRVLVEQNFGSLGSCDKSNNPNTCDNLNSPNNPDQLYWCQMIIKNARRGRYLEIPGGPLLNWDDEETKKAVFAKIRAIAQREKCVFVRLRPQLKIRDQSKLAGLSLRKAPMHLHAEHTVILDLAKSEDDLLKDMRRQTRYEVRRATKLNIVVSWGNDQALFEEFHRVQTETATRQHFVPPDSKMLLAEREAFGDQARLYVAKTAENEPIAYGLILIDGSEAEYFEAASTELNYKMPGAYALQWQVIRDLKRLGIKRYNLWGIAPPGQPQHRYAGVTTFKKGFGGETVEFVPAQDIVINPLRYQFNYLVETIRRKRRKL